MILDFVAHTRKPLGSVDCIDRIQQILTSLVPDYLEPILIEEDIGQADRIRIDLKKTGDLANCVTIELARSNEGAKRWMEILKDKAGGSFRFERQLGWIHLATVNGTRNVHFRFDQYGLAPNVDKLQFGNSLSIESREIQRHGKELAEGAQTVMKRILDNDLFDYGYCCPSDQYDVKNLDRTGGGVCAVGLDASKCLPGFYWGNYFGSFLCDLVGEEKLMEVPGCRSYRLQSGVLVVNELPPDSWSEPMFIENENKAMDYIGRDLFFEKGKAMTGKLFN